MVGGDAWGGGGEEGMVKKGYFCICSEYLLKKDFEFALLRRGAGSNVNSIGVCYGWRTFWRGSERKEGMRKGLGIEVFLFIGHF